MLCLQKFCIPAQYFLNQIINDPPHNRRISYNGEDEDEPPCIADLNLYLVPNPTHDNVAVMGIEPAEIKEIVVVSLEAKQVATFQNTHQFSVGNLSPGIYIVRVVTKDNQTNYLKLLVK